MLVLMNQKGESPALDSCLNTRRIITLSNNEQMDKAINKEDEAGTASSVVVVRKERLEDRF